METIFIPDSTVVYITILYNAVRVVEQKSLADRIRNVVYVEKQSVNNEFGTQRFETGFDKYVLKTLLYFD